MLSPDQCAVLFDLDGVIVDSKEVHYLAFKRFAEEQGLPFSRALFQKLFGMHNNDIFPIMFGRPLPQEQIDQMAEHKEAFVREMLHGHVEALPGAKQFILALYEAGFHLAIGTSTPRANLELILNELELCAYFQALVSAENVKEGKPNPQVFLLGAQALGILPDRCVVVEDAVPGVQAAHNGGMKALAVTTNHSREALDHAERVVDSLEEVGPADVLHLLSSESAGIRHGITE
jgi:beta-phosphoglucomutase